MRKMSNLERFTALVEAGAKEVDGSITWDHPEDEAGFQAFVRRSDGVVGIDGIYGAEAFAKDPVWYKTPNVNWGGWGRDDLLSDGSLL